MAKIYNGIEGIPKPEFGCDYTVYDKLCDHYVTALKKWAKKNGSCPEAGEEISFPVADGRARYIVVSLKPVTLVHLDVDDAWHFKYANRLTAKDIREEITRSQALQKIFSKGK